ncbi:MAG: hypothetical protein GXY44_16125 [Phycisphaerales bacterium]|nr:hypothetical protein [Phycisphaerales bacterium]
MDTTADKKWAWPGMLIGGCVTGIPLGWLLAYLAFLPVYLGLFFFMLLGLIPGAFMYRLGSSKAPLHRGVLWLAGLIVSLLIGVTTLFAEYRGLENNVVQTIEGSYRRGLPADQRHRVRSMVSEHIGLYLNNNYPPGGFSGYLRWAGTDGELECEVDLDRPVSFSYRLPQRRKIWLTRVLLSFVLLAGAVLSQVLGLAKRRESNEIVESEASPPSPGGTTKP